MRLLPRLAVRPCSAALRVLLIGLMACSSPCWASTHVVKPGESLWGVAKRYRTTVVAIREASALDSDQIHPGQKLIIPSSAKPPAAAQRPANNPPPHRTPVAKARAASLPTPPAQVAPSAVVVPATNPVARVAPPSARTRAAAERLYARVELPAKSSLEEVPPSWVTEPPAPFTQFEKSNAARRGIEPCVAPDPGFGPYSKWVQVAPMAHVLAPTANTLTADGGFDVLVHFHGREPIRKEWVRVMDRAVLVAVDVGIDSGSYADAFRDPRTLRQVLLAVEAEMAERTGVRGAHVRHLALSAWSAGYGAIEQLLRQPFTTSTADSVILLDGLHVGYQGRSLDQERMAPFVKYAEAATQGDHLFFVSHSSILTPGYASSTETARYLVWKTGGRPKAVDAIESDPMGLERIALFNQGSFHVRGFRGNGASDHCAQLGLMRDVLRVHLRPRWQQLLPKPPTEQTPLAPAPPDVPEQVPSVTSPSQLARLTRSDPSSSDPSSSNSDTGKPTRW